MKAKVPAIHKGRITEVDDKDVDYDLEDPSAYVGSHINLIPLQSSVQGPRLFYGARFMEQAVPVQHNEEPWVQNLKVDDPDGKSFDDHFGKSTGTLHAQEEGEVGEITPDFMTLNTPAGKKVIPLYRDFPFNRKSVTGDTILTLRRSKQIFLARADAYQHQAGDETLSYDPVSKMSSWQLVTAYIAHTNDKQLFRVTFESGRHVTITEDHSLLTLNDAWELSAITPDKCIEGQTRCPLVFATVEESGDDTDYEEGVIAGVYLAEGHLGKQKGLISFAAMPPARVEQLRDLVERVRKFKTHDGELNCTFTDHDLHGEFRRNFGSGSGSKFINCSIFNKPKKYLEGLISGYMAGDGCLWLDSNGAVQLAGVSTSRQLRDDLVFVLQLLGVMATVWDAPRRHLNENWSDAYGFRVLSFHINKLRRWFFYDDREEKLRLLTKAKFRASSFEHLPFPRGSRKLVYRSLGGTRVPHFVYKSATEGKISKRRLTHSAGVIKQWADSDIMWDTITRIDPQPHQACVYDLSVVDSQAFSAGLGLLVHNTSISHRPVVKTGDKVTPGQLLAATNFTNDKGTLAMGLNARIGLVPYKGYSMDDAVVISASFAKRLTSQHSNVYNQDFDDTIKGGRDHFRSLFPDKFTKEQLDKLDERGVVKPGVILDPGDPIILATRPKMISSTNSQLGRLSKTMRQARSDSSQVWDGQDQATVTDVAHLRGGAKAVLSVNSPTRDGDKIVLRSGQKGITSLIIPDEHMPRTLDGKPLEMLLNPLGIPSRANNSLVYELLLGKAAAAKGAPIKIPSFTKNGEKWYDLVRKQLVEAGQAEEEEVFDPMTNSKLEQPITVGNGYVLKLHHTAESKIGSRGQGSYDCFDSITEVLTRRGWVAWPDVTESDELFVPAEDRQTGCYEKPMRLVAYEFDGDLECYESRFLNWAVTPNHEFLTKSPKGSWKKEKVTVLKGRQNNVIPQFGVQLKGAGNPKIKIIPGLVGGKRRLAENRKNLMLPFSDYVRLAAWWLAEGTVTAGDRLIIWQSSEANKEKCDEIFKLVSRMTKAGVNRLGRGAIQVHDPRLSVYFSRYGNSSQTKRVPKDIIMASPEMIKLFFETYAKGDGHHGYFKKADGRRKLNHTLVIASSSKLLMDDLQRAAIHAGLGFIPRKIVEAGATHVFPHGGTCVLSDCWGGALHFDRSVASVVPAVGKARYTGTWETMPYKGKVYCATTSTGLLYVRRDGKPFVSGNSNQQPLKGGGAGGQAKRTSGLEMAAMMSSGAYANIREDATLRGQQNHEYWMRLRSGQKPTMPGKPFVWDKFRGLLAGAGLHTKDLPGGKIRLGPLTDKLLAEHEPMEVRHGGMVNFNTLVPEDGGLFDPAMVGNRKWGQISLPFKIVSPASEDAVRRLLGLRKQDIRDIMAGKMELPKHLEGTPQL